MKIKSFGCSFIFGTDLPDNPSSAVLNNPIGQYSRLTWPALIAQYNGFDYECYARPGSGNLQIAERTLKECAIDPHGLFVVSWSWIDRFDYIATDDEWQPWETVRPKSNDSIGNFYFKYLQSEYKDKLTSLIYAKSVLDTFVANKIKFIMTFQDSLMFDQRWHASPAVKKLQENLLPYMTTFEGMTFLDWSRKHGFPESTTWHPLESAHRAAADYILTVLDKQKTNGPVQPARV